MTSLKQNTIYNLVKMLSATIFPLIAFPYATRMLLVDSLGKVNFGLSIISFFSLLASLGISVYAIRECSKVKNDVQRLERTASEIFSINCCSTLLSYLLLALTLLLARPLEEYRILIIIQSLSIAFATLGADWLNNVFEDFKFIAIRTVCFQVLSLLLLFLLVHGPDDYLLYAGITVVSNSGAALLNVIYRRRFCRLHFVWPMHARKHLSPILMLFGMQVSQIILTNSDQTMLGLIKGDYDVGIYSLAVNVYSMANVLAASIAWVVMPRLAIGFMNKDYCEVNDVLSYAARFLITIGMPIVTGLFVLAPEIIWLLSGASFLDSIEPLRILAGALAVSYFYGYLINIIMLPSNRENIVLVSSIICTLVNVILNFLFIPTFGYIAAAVTTVISEVLGIATVLPFAEKEIRLNNLARTIASSLLGCLSICVIAVCCSVVIQDMTMRSFVSIIASVIIYFLLTAALKNELIADALRAALARINRRKS